MTRVSDLVTVVLALTMVSSLAACDVVFAEPEETQTSQASDAQREGLAEALAQNGNGSGEYTVPEVRERDAEYGDRGYMAAGNDGLVYFKWLDADSEDALPCEGVCVQMEVVVPDGCEVLTMTGNWTTESELVVGTSSDSAENLQPGDRALLVLDTDEPGAEMFFFTESSCD